MGSPAFYKGLAQVVVVAVVLVVVAEMEVRLVCGGVSLRIVLVMVVKVVMLVWCFLMCGMW